MLAKKHYLIISSINSSIKLLLTMLAEFEYKPAMFIDIVILNSTYTENEIDKLIKVLAYFSQMNYLNHTFRIFTNNINLIQRLEKNKKLLNIKDSIQSYKLVKLITEEITDRNGIIINNYLYDFIINITNKIEILTNNIDIRIDIHGNGSI